VQWQCQCLRQAGSPEPGAAMPLWSHRCWSALVRSQVKRKALDTKRHEPCCPLYKKNQPRALLASAVAWRNLQETQLRVTSAARV